MAGDRINDVNIALGDDVSNMLYEASKLTWENRPGAVVEMHPSFSGWRAIAPGYKPSDCYEGMGSDGVGTKVEIAERTRDYSTIAHDLFAMVCDDAVVRGAEPIAINTVLDVNRLLEHDTLTTTAVQQLARGYVEAARKAGVVILNGETAELGNRVGSDYENAGLKLNWCGTVLWYAQRDRILTGSQLKPGDTLVGFKEHGFRSNGITAVRKAMFEHHGPEWHDEVVDELGNLSLDQQVQRPSAIYSGFVVDLTGGFDAAKEPKAAISGVAHITGGGQPSKLGRMLEPAGLGAHLYSPSDPPEIMTYTQRLSGLSDIDAYRTWHMGYGMVVATSEPDKVLEHAEQWGIDAIGIGEVIGLPGIRIRNRGVYSREAWLSFSPG